MDELIQKLVEFDKQCVNRVKAAKEKKDAALSHPEEKKQAIFNNYMKSQKEVIEEHKKQLISSNNLAEQEKKEEFQKNLSSMEELFNKNKDKWVQDIVERCMK